MKARAKYHIIFSS